MTLQVPADLVLDPVSTSSSDQCLSNHCPIRGEPKTLPYLDVQVIPLARLPATTGHTFAMHQSIGTSLDLSSLNFVPHGPIYILHFVEFLTYFPPLS